MKPYPRYKPTGLAWLPSVPEHWEVVKIGRLFRLFLGKMLTNAPSSPEDTFERYACAKDVHFSGVDTSDLKEMWFSPKEKDFYQTKLGDLLVVEGGAGAGGAAIVENEDGFYIQNSLHLLRPKSERGSARFLKYWIYSIVSRGYIPYICNKATIPHFTKEKVFYTSMPLPPPSEQDRIVRYLDEKTAAIDELVRAKEREIELLRERKQALVSAAVTGGLDPATERKDSGVPWIGRIPKGWNKDKVTRIFSVVGSGTTPESGNMEFYSGATIPWMNSGDLYSGEAYITSTERKVTEAAIQKSSALKLYSGETIVIAMYGASIGNLGIANFSFCANQACCCLSNPRNGFATKYLFYALSSCKLNWLEASKGGSQPNISQNIIRQTWLPVPPLPEQRRIVAHLDSACSELDAAEAAIRKQIALLQELRTRLVSDAVTGAVEV